MAYKRLLSIGEFSKLTGIPRSKLIYYDEIGLFVAAERGENNYRYYSLNQIISASFISDMSSFGVPLKDLLSLKHTRSPQAMTEVLSRAIDEHQKKILKLKESQSIMEVMSQLMKLGIEAEEIMEAEGSDTFIRELEYEPRHIALGNENIHQDVANFYPAWLSFMNSAKRAGANIKYPVGGYFDSMERFLSNPNMPSRFYFVNPHGKTVREGGRWLAGYVRGFYGTTNGLANAMQEYAQSHGLTLVGPVYNTFLIDEISSIERDDYLMRASVKILEDQGNKR